MKTQVEIKFCAETQLATESREFDSDAKAKSQIMTLISQGFVSFRKRDGTEVFVPLAQVLMFTLKPFGISPKEQAPS
jgi:hypothetical protein